MLNEKIRFDTKKYKDIFTHKLANLCKKSPALLNYYTADSYVIVQDLFTGKEQKFMFEYDRDIKSGIHDIVVWLKENCYPIIIEQIEVEKKLTKEDVDIYIAMGRSEELDKLVLNGNKTIVNKKYRIDKIIIGTYKTGESKDEIFITDLKTNKTFQYRLNMPATIFLKQVRDKFTPEEAFVKFKSISEFIKECE